MAPPIALGLRGLGVGRFGTYWQKVLATGPIAYWPLWEKSGTVAHCLTNPAMDGTYNSDVSGWPPQTGIGDGNTAPYFDGTNDYVNIQTAALTAAYSGTAGSMAIWAKVANAGVWTDGTQRRALTLEANALNMHYLARHTTNGWFWWRRRANSVYSQVAGDVGSLTTWMHLVMTWNQSTDELKAYLNGVQYSLTQSLIDSWAGALAVALIGAQVTTPAQVWSGRLAHPAIWGGYVLPLSTIQRLAKVP